MARQSYKPEEKAKIVIEILKGEESATDISKKYNCPLSSAMKWKSLLEQEAYKLFQHGGFREKPFETETENDGEIAMLKQIIGDLTIENMKLKQVV